MSEYPFPGLRAFRPEETDIFFGRDEQTDDLLECLDRSRFLAVVGPSGCGKSSLVRTGLLASLHAGFLSSAGASWRVAEMRPRGQPLTNLALALMGDDALGSEVQDIADSGERELRASFLRAILQRGPLGLKEVIDQNPLPEGASLLLLVDQFEEIFRYRRIADRDEADAFVALLLASAQQQDVPIYVVITMRSDFLGDCALFPGLPEAINQGQYLTPRLSRDQLSESIEGPAEVFGCDVDPALTNRLLNAIGSRQDQLPVLQHALMRMWTTAREQREDNLLAFDDYKRVGEFKEALSLHADEAFNELEEEQKVIAKDLFCLLTERSRGLRDTRRPVELGEVARVAGCDIQRVVDVVEVFRRSDRSFLMPPWREVKNLSEHTLLDISHESLIRQWDRLNEWVAREARSAETYRRLEETARLWEQGEAGLWGTPDLEIALQWREREQPNETWAGRYGSYFPLAMKFLDASLQRQEQEKAEEEAELQAAREEKVRRLQDKLEKQVQQRELQAAKEVAAEAQARSKAEEKIADEARAREKAQRKAKTRLTIGLVVAVALTLLSVFQRMWIEEEKAKVESEKEKVVQQSERAERSAEEAQKQREIAEDKAIAADKLAEVAEELRVLADDRRIEAEDRRREAQALLLAVRARDYLDDQLDLALLLDVEAGREAGGARTSLVEALEHRPEITRFLHDHRERANTVAYSPDGTRLASGGEDNAVFVYDLDVAPPRPTRLEGHTKRVNSVAYSPDGRWLVSASRDKTLILRDAESGEIVRTFIGHDDGIASAAFSPDSRMIASAGWDKTVRVWRVDDAGSPPRILEHNAVILSVAFSPDGVRLAAGAQDNTVLLWDLETDESKRYETHTGKVTAVAFSPEGRWLASGSWDGTIALHDMRATEIAIEETLLHSHPVLALAFNHDGTELVSGTRDSSIVRWRLQDITTDDATIEQAVFRKQLVQTLAFNNYDTALRPDTVTWTREKFPGHSDWVKSVAFHPDGRHLASASGGTTSGRVILWDLDADERLGTTFWNQAMFIPRRDVKVTRPGGVRINGEEVSLLSRDSVESLMAQDDPEGIIRHSYKISSAAFSPDRRLLATGARDNTIVLWDLEQQTYLYPPLTGHKDWISGVTFSLDSELLVSGGRDASILLWDVSSGGLAGQLTGPAEVDGVVFSPAGKRQLASYHQGKAVLWDLNDVSWREQACEIANRNLTRDEWRRFFEDKAESPYRCTCPGLPCE